MQVNITVSNEVIMSLLDCALEGGSNYWYVDVSEGNAPEFSELGYEDYEWWQKYPVLGGSIVVVAPNKDSDEEKLVAYQLDRSRTEIGLALMAEKSPWHFGNAMNGNEDAETGDVFLQYCLYGEIVYG